MSVYAEAGGDVGRWHIRRHRTPLGVLVTPAAHCDLWPPGGTRPVVTPTKPDSLYPSLEALNPKP